jgi:lactoylglutathione lyase
MRYAHTCYRVFDLDRAVDFYVNGLGLVEQGRFPIRDEAINVFLAAPETPDFPLELTFNLGRTEPYEIGTGYGHIALHVGDLDATLAALAAKGIDPERPPYTVREGGSRICFVRDPDGYRIELVERAEG